MSELERHAQWQDGLERDLMRVHTGKLSSGDFVMLYGWAPKAISIDDIDLIIDAVGEEVSEEVREAIVRVKAAIGWDYR